MAHITIKLAAALSSLAFALGPRDASACGGSFSPPPDPQNPETVEIAAQRMALAVSKTQTVLWSQIQYQGPPSEFVWVLPVAAGATIELANNAWFDALDAATATHIVPPGACAATESYDDGGSSGGCAMSGCGAGDSAAPGGLRNGDDPGTQGGGGVTVVSKGSLGPYETVTLSSQNGEAVKDWLGQNGFAVPNDVAPILDEYTSQGLDFIALRLKSESTTGQMQPVRVVMDGASPMIPFRMMMAGARETVPITLYVLSEGRQTSQSYPEATLNYNQLIWDFAVAESNYLDLRNEALGASDSGRGFLTTFALGAALHSSVPGEQGADVVFSAPGPEGPVASNSIAGLYFTLAGINNTLSPDCSSIPGAIASNGANLVEACEPGSCSGGVVSASQFECEGANDVAAALIGMRPNDLWVTRLEASLPRQGLTADLALQPAAKQEAMSSWVTAPESDNCDNVVETASLHNPRPRPQNMAWITAAAAFGAVFLRRKPRSTKRHLD